MHGALFQCPLQALLLPSLNNMSFLPSNYALPKTEHQFDPRIVQSLFLRNVGNKYLALKPRRLKT